MTFELKMLLQIVIMAGEVTLADLFMHIPGFKPSWDSHETAVKPR